MSKRKMEPLNEREEVEEAEVFNECSDSTDAPGPSSALMTILSTWSSQKIYLKAKKAMLMSIKEIERRSRELESNRENDDTDYSELDSSNLGDAGIQAAERLAKAAMLMLIAKKGDKDYDRIKKKVQVTADDDYLTVTIKYKPRRRL